MCIIETTQFIAVNFINCDKIVGPEQHQRYPAFSYNICDNQQQPQLGIINCHFRANQTKPIWLRTVQKVIQISEIEHDL